MSTKFQTAFGYVALLLALMLLVPLISCGGHGGTIPNPVTTLSFTGNSTPGTSAPPSTISSLSGEVLVKKQGSTTWVAAVAGMKLGAGDQLQTGGNGTALLLFFEGSTLEVQARSAILIKELTLAGNGSTTIGLKQLVGNTVSRVQKLADSASRYEVDTAAGSAVVRGTVFGVVVEADGYSTVTCDEGQVWFSASGVTVLVSQGQQSDATVGGTPSKPSPIVTSTPRPTYSPITKPTPTPTPAPTAVPLPTPLPVITVPGGGGSTELTPASSPIPPVTTASITVITPTTGIVCWPTGQPSPIPPAVVLSGSGFTPYATVYIQVYGEHSNHVTQADASGGFSFSVSVEAGMGEIPGQSLCNRYVGVTAFDTNGRRAQTGFEIYCSGC